MDVPVSRYQLERSHRLGPKVDRNGKARHRNSIIKFNRYNVRNKDGHRRVFVSEYTTATRGVLAYRTTTLKNEGRITDCWTVAGKIMVKNRNGTHAELSVYGQV